MQVLSHNIYENVFLTQTPLKTPHQEGVHSATTRNQLNSKTCYQIFSPAKTNEKNKIYRYDF